MTTKTYGRWLVFCVATIPVTGTIAYKWLGGFAFIFAMKLGVMLMLLGRVFWKNRRSEEEQKPAVKGE